MQTIDSNPHHESGEALATRGTENGLSNLLDHRGGRKKDPELQKTTYNYRYVVQSGILEDCRGCLHTTPEHHFRSSCILDNEITSRRNCRALLW